MAQKKYPLLWSLSNKSGALFQQPLFTALNIDDNAWALCSSSSSARLNFDITGKLLQTPPIITNTSSVPNFFFNAFDARKLLEQQITEKANLVHITMSSPIDAFYLTAARKSNVPIVLTIHDDSRHLGEKNIFLDAIDRSIRNKVDHIVTVSKYVYDELSRQKQSTPIHCVPNGLLTRDVLGLKTRTLMCYPAKILFLGRIHEYKGLALLLKSLDLLDSKGIFTQLTIAGSGDLSPYVGAMGRRRNITVINEWIDDATILKLLNENDVLALPYLEASQSGVAIDAQWAAMPAVATPVGALPQQFANGVDALISQGVTAEDFADSMAKILTDVTLFRKLSKGAHDAYKQKDLGAVAENWRTFYNSLTPTNR